jgi:hypothetical protein
VFDNPCTPSNHHHGRYLGYGQLHLHLLVKNQPPLSEVLDEADCFRLFLNIYPDSVGIKDSFDQSPYDLAVEQNLSAYFLRMLLTVNP